MHKVIHRGRYVYFATGDKHFESIQSRRLIFDGDHLAYKVPIAIYDNSLREISKTFSVQLSLISGVRTHLMPSAMDVTIEEDDAINGKKAHLLPYVCILAVYT